VLDVDADHGAGHDRRLVVVDPVAAATELGVQAVPGGDLHGAVAVVGADGVHVGGRLSDTEAALYQEWIANDRRLRALLTQMRKIAAQATQLIMDEAKNRKVKV